MAFSSSNLSQTAHGGLTGGQNGLWTYVTSDSTATTHGTGYFAGVGRGSRGAHGAGLSTGDFVLCLHGSTAATLSFVSASTANQASTSASTGWGAAYNASLTAIV